VERAGQTPAGPGVRITTPSEDDHWMTHREGADHDDDRIHPLTTMTNRFLFYLVFIGVVAFASLGASSVLPASNLATQVRQCPIRPYQANPFYWEFRGEPILLIGASDYHNIFQRPDLVEHLERLREAGGNYVRNTMASREILPGHRDLWPYEVDWNVSTLPHQTRDPLTVVYDLTRWNEAYWERFERMLQTTADLGMVVEIEIWERHDKYRTRDQAGWERHPYNPDNNVNYTAEESQLPTGEWTQDPGHPFFATVPALDNNELVLEYQRAFVDKILAYTFRHDHVLYNMNNETKESHEWGTYWAEYILERAEEEGVEIYVTDMQDAHDITDDSVIRVVESDLYAFVDISQNNFQSEETHWERIRFIRDQLVDDPKPITNVKIYGADGAPAPSGFWGTTQDGVERFWRNIMGGASAVRFHRPPWGIGLSDVAASHLRSAILFLEEMDVFSAVPQYDLLTDRQEDEAYALANPGSQYAIYFPNGGSVTVNLSGDNTYQYRWMNLDRAEWREPGHMQAGPDVRITTPSEDGHWIIVLSAQN
jgi:hypothetical protein